MAVWVKVVLVLIVLALVVVVVAVWVSADVADLVDGARDPLARCFRVCELVYGDHDNNPSTPMRNRDGYLECVGGCIKKYEGGGQ